MTGACLIRAEVIDGQPSRDLFVPPLQDMPSGLVQMKPCEKNIIKAGYKECVTDI